MGCFELPEGYKEIKRVDLHGNIMLNIFINLAALAVMAALFFLGAEIVPFSIEISADDFGADLLKMLAVLAGILLYVVLHELLHGIFIKKYSGKRAKYGFKGAFAYAGSDAYFERKPYIIIALAPVVFFGIIFLLLNIFLTAEWFWWIYILQMMNLSGAVGDAYITYLMIRLPADVLTRDEGVAMTMYSRKVLPKSSDK